MYLGASNWSCHFQKPYPRSTMPCLFIIIAKLVCKEKKKNYNKSHVITSIKFVKFLWWKAMKKEVVQNKESKKKEIKGKKAKQVIETFNVVKWVVEK